MRQMITQCIANGLIFKYILADSWFSSVENLKFIADKKSISFLIYSQIVCLPYQKKIEMLVIRQELMS